MNYPEINSSNSPTKLIVFIHGVGSDGHDLISLVPYMQKSLNDCHFISPHGVEEYDMATFGRQWFSLQDRTPSVIQKLLKKNTPLLLKLIREKQKELQLTNADTILFGFSQGTMIGNYLTLIEKEPFAAMIGFSGMLCTPDNIENKSTPFCIIHGQNDEVLSVEEAFTAEKIMNKNGIKYEISTIPNLNHSIDMTGIEFAVKFIKKHCY